MWSVILNLEDVASSAYAIIEPDLGNVQEYDILSVDLLVRCKDCKWWTKQEESLQGRCDAYSMYPTGEWYCARGERKDNGDNH